MYLTILTIDLNIIMSPSWKLYGDKILEFSNIQELIPHGNFLWYAPADFEAYHKIIQEIILPNKEKIHWIKSQEDIIHFLRQKKYDTLINVDFNSDIENYSNLRILNNTNWLSYAIDNQLIDNAIWIRDFESNSDLKNYNTKIDATLILKNSLLNLIKPDLIIISESREWILPQYFPLIDALKDICTIDLNAPIKIEEYIEDRYI